MASATLDFDVIIVGSRPAGASLAILLGQKGLSVLLVDRGTFPSSPPVSCPLIFAPAMQLLDELGVDEADYACNTPKIHSFSVGVARYFDVTYELPAHQNRAYAYCIDRKRFDYALVRKVHTLPTVTVMNGFNVTGIRKQDARVYGIQGRNSDGETCTYTARCVVGADGRFSTIAKLVESPVTKEWKRLSSAVLYAYWQDVKPLHGGPPTVQMYVPESGLLYMLLDGADNTTGIIVHGAQKKVYGSDKAQAAYQAHMQRSEVIRNRLGDARQMGKLRGVRKLRNVYRKAGGPGWFLTGDAVHHRDTLDGQGIYEAFLTSRLLAHAIEQILVDDRPWDEAVAWYEDMVHASTYPMCKATLSRLVWAHRIPWPGWIIRTFIYWLFCHGEYKENFMRLHLRDIDPKDWLKPSLMVRAFWEGIRGNAEKKYKAGH